jgi:hypothetical protein
MKVGTRAAAKFRRPTRVFEDAVQKDIATFDDVVASRGGNPLIEDGKLIGAIGLLRRHRIARRGGLHGWRCDDQQIAAALLNANNTLFYWSLFRICAFHGNAHGNNRKLTMRGQCQAEMLQGATYSQTKPLPLFPLAWGALHSCWRIKL